MTIEHVISCVKQIDSLDNISFHNASVSADQKTVNVSKFEMLIAFLGSHRKLHTLYLSGMDLHLLSGDQWITLLHALEQLPELRYLSLDNNQLSSAYLLTLITRRFFHNIEVLVISNNNVNVLVLESLFKKMTKSKNSLLDVFVDANIQWRSFGLPLGISPRQNELLNNIARLLHFRQLSQGLSVLCNVSTSYGERLKLLDELERSFNFFQLTIHPLREVCKEPKKLYELVQSCNERLLKVNASMCGTSETLTSTSKTHRYLDYGLKQEAAASQHLIVASDTAPPPVARSKLMTVAFSLHPQPSFKLFNKQMEFMHAAMKCGASICAG